MTPRFADRRLLLLVGICLFLFFFGLGSRALWDVDEGVHSTAAKYVVESGDWVTPMFNGEAFFDKPMFFTWLVAISFTLLGFTELAARLPAALLGLGGVVVTYLLGRRMFGRRAGFLGGAILATSLLFVVMARTVVHDSALAFCTTVALTVFYFAVIEPQGRRLHLLLFYIAVSGAVLAKGPLGLLLPAMVIVPFLLLTRRLALVKEMRLGQGTILFLTLTVPWYALMSLRNAGYLRYFLIEKNFGSFASATSTHPAPFYFYVPILLGALLPWTGFLPTALVRAIARWRGKERDPYLYLLLWLGVMFLFFSVATSKLATYLLPLVPAAAILIGRLWDEALAEPVGEAARALLRWQLPVTVVVLIGLVYGLFDPPFELETKYGLAPGQVLTVGLLIASGSIVTLLCLWRQRLASSFASIVVMVAAIVTVFAMWLGPAMNDYRSTRDLALEADPLFPPGEPMVFLWREKDSALFYTDRYGQVLPAWEVADYLARDDEVFFLADVRKLHLLLEHRDRLGVIMRRGGGVVISNRPAAERPAAVPEGFER